MTKIFSSAVLIVALCQAISVTGLRCRCTVSSKQLGINVSLGYVINVAPTGDVDEYHDSLVSQRVEDSLANADFERSRKDWEDVWESHYAEERESWWPCRPSGTCDISHGSATWLLMVEFQLGRGVVAPPGSLPICINASNGPEFQFLSCGILPGGYVASTNEECPGNGILAGSNRTSCVYSFSEEGTATSPNSTTMAQGLLAAAAYQAETLVCPCSVNVSMRYGGSTIRVVSSERDDEASMRRELTRRAWRTGCANPLGSCPDGRDAASLVVPVWPGCNQGRCEIRRGLGAVWQRMLSYQFEGGPAPADAQPACVRAMVANELNGRGDDWTEWYDKTGQRDKTRFVGCAIISRMKATEPTGVCRREYGISGNESFCIQEILPAIGG